jgi:hypothetical protein
MTVRLEASYARCLTRRVRGVLAPLFLCLPLRFVQLLLNLLFLAANVAQMTLEQR